MLIIGLAGKARSGKDTVADYLVAKYGFMKFSFSDALYREVSEAFNVSQLFLRDAVTKDAPSMSMRLSQCSDGDFTNIACSALGTPSENMEYVYEWPFSPRQILQCWGTEYRRAHRPLYWIHRAAEWLDAQRSSTKYPEHAPSCFVNTSVRFLNEQDWVHDMDGNVWHIFRDGIEAVNDHVSETPLTKFECERAIYNNDTIERLHYGVDLLLKDPMAEFVRVEPLEVEAGHAGMPPAGLEIINE